jgi:D-glycero-beta-D-manno-heptose 1-phosphate adenylyltransferase
MGSREWKPIADRMIFGVYGLDELKAEIDRDPDRWRPLVFTNGCFDLLHAGHVRYLREAATFGRSLVVGLNSDASVQMLKPQNPGRPVRPIVPQAQRAEVLAALKSVAGVVLFDELTATVPIEVLKPEVYVKGGDYRPDTLPEAPTVRAYGGQIVLIQIEVPSSTTAIVDRILGNRE